MEPRKMLDDRQPQTRSANVSGPASIDPVEPLKYPLCMSLEKAFAGVCNGDQVCRLGKKAKR